MVAHHFDFKAVLVMVFGGERPRLNFGALGLGAGGVLALIGQRACSPRKPHPLLLSGPAKKY